VFDPPQNVGATRSTAMLPSAAWAMIGAPSFIARAIVAVDGVYVDPFCRRSGLPPSPPPRKDAFTKTLLRAASRAPRVASSAGSHPSGFGEDALDDLEVKPCEVAAIQMSDEIGSAEADGVLRFFCISTSARPSLPISLPGLIETITVGTCGAPKRKPWRLIGAGSLKARKKIAAESRDGSGVEPVSGPLRAEADHAGL